MSKADQTKRAVNSVAFRRRSTHLALAVACAAAVAGDAPGDPVKVESAAPGTAPVGIVHRADAVKAFVEAAQTRRVDIAGIGDSNQLRDGTYGHDHGVQKAWANRFGMYATGVLPGNAEGGAAALGVEFSPGGSAGMINVAPAPYATRALPKGDVGYLQGYGYVPPGSALSSTDGAVMFGLPSSAPFDRSHTLKWHVQTGTFATGAGSFELIARYGSTTQYVGRSGVVSTNTGAAGVRDSVLTIPGGSTDPTKAVWFSYWAFGVNAVNGPFYAESQRLEDADRTKGVAYSSLLYQGGKAAVHAAQTLQSTPDAPLREWMRQTVALQTGAPTLMVNVLHGGNDRNPGLPISAGPNPAPSDTGPGFRDNIDAIVTRLRGLWAANGYDPSRLYFTVGGYHPLPGEFSVEKQEAFEQAAMAYADSTYNVAVVRGTRLTSPLTMRANGYYAPDGDAHLSPAGFEVFDRLAVTQLVSAALNAAAGRSTVSSLSFKLPGAAETMLSPAALRLVGPDGQPLATPDLAVRWDDATQTATWTFPGLDAGLLAPGQYTATLLASGVTDEVGQSVLDGNGDGTPGDNYTFSFTANVPEPGGLAAVGLAAFGLLQRRRRR